SRISLATGRWAGPVAGKWAERPRGAGQLCDARGRALGGVEVANSLSIKEAEAGSRCGSRTPSSDHLLVKILASNYKDILRRRFWAQPSHFWLPSCGKSATMSFIQKNLLRTPCGPASVTTMDLLLLLQDKEKEVEELLQELQCDKAQAKTASELSKSMESMRGDLQAQLRCKEAEIGRLCLQIKSLEQHGNQHKAEVEAMMEQLKALKQKGDRDKETLKKAIRAQKERAEKSEEYAEQLQVQLADKDLYVSESLSTLDSWRSRYNQVVKEKGDLELEIIILNDRVADLLNQQHSLEEKMREERDSLVERLHQQTAEYSAFKIENERLKATFGPMEDNLNQTHLEVQQLKASLKNYEGMIDNYKSQVMKNRLEADEVAAQLEHYYKENKLLKAEMNNEIEAARRQFQSQLADLQQLPDILKITEAKLAECQDQLQGYERKNIDLTAIISDLRSRIYYLGLCSERQKQASPLFRSNLSLSYWNHISQLHLSKPPHTSYFFV
ncbi:Outer dense fiber protein 2, partial [Lemmus lemmus]